MDWMLKDTYALRLGGAYRWRITPSLSLTLRAGTFFETATTAVSDTSLSVLGPQRLGVTGGLGIRWGRFTLDTAYAHIFLPDSEVKSYDPDSMEFEPEDVSLSRSAPARAPETRQASRPAPRSKARRTRRRSRRYRRGRRSRGRYRRTSTRKRKRKRRSVCLERNAEGACVRARMVDSVVSI